MYAKIVHAKILVTNLYCETSHLAPNAAPETKLLPLLIWCCDFEHLLSQLFFLRVTVKICAPSELWRGITWTDGCVPRSWMLVVDWVDVYFLARSYAVKRITRVLLSANNKQPLWCDMTHKASVDSCSNYQGVVVCKVSVILYFAYDCSELIAAEEYLLVYILENILMLHAGHGQARTHTSDNSKMALVKKCFFCW